MAVRRYGTIVSTNWLREQIKNTKRLKNQPIRVLETTWLPDTKHDIYKELYLPSHIPSSQYFNFINCAPSTQYYKRSVPDMNIFTEAAQSLGIDDNTHVIAYDRTTSLSSFRTWWLFRLFGHRRISVLDGGFNKWVSDGFEITNETTKYEKGNFEAKYDSTLIRDYESMIENVKTNKEQVMDSRGSQAFEEGETHLPPEVKRGHLPGAKNIPFLTLFYDDGTFKSEQDLKLLFNAASIDLGKPVTAMCETGLTACALAAAGNILGKEMIPVYAGSIFEWGQRAPEELCIKGKS